MHSYELIVRISVSGIEIEREDGIVLPVKALLVSCSEQINIQNVGPVKTSTVSTTEKRFVKRLYSTCPVLFISCLLCLPFFFLFFLHSSLLHGFLRYTTDISVARLDFSTAAVSGTVVAEHVSEVML